ncbi:MAG TPA: hypothetical protein VE053_03675 [Allosphingosinicella sp.]|nr:hypothetical protein [Allosphingosinicella sp.]
MEPKQPETPADIVAATPARTAAPAVPDALAGALPAWDLLPDAPVRRK